MLTNQIGIIDEFINFILFVSLIISLSIKYIDFFLANKTGVIAAEINCI